MITSLHKLHIKTKNVLGAVSIRNDHHKAVGKTHAWRLVFKFLKRPAQIGGRFNENELTPRSKELSHSFEGGLMTASFP